MGPIVITGHDEATSMLRSTVLLLLLALSAAGFGFGAGAATVVGPAELLFVGFLALSSLTLVAGVGPRREG